VFARYTLAFTLQLRKKHGKTSVRVAGECQLAKGIKKSLRLPRISTTMGDGAWLLAVCCSAFQEHVSLSSLKAVVQ
jgi:hypothetical protein